MTRSWDEVALVITTWRRPWYLARALESWSDVPELPQLNRVIVAVGRSDQENAIQWLARLWANRIAPVPVLVVEDSPAAAEVTGEHRALGEAIDYGFRRQGVTRLVVTSEDVIVSDDVLRYVQWCAAQPELDALICAHNNIGQGWQDWYDDAGADQDAVRLTGSFSPWCWSLNAAQWRNVLRGCWDWDATSGDNDMERGWDWQVQRLVSRFGRAVVSPCASRAQNIGAVGGVYAVPDNYPATVASSFRNRRGQVAYRLVP